MKQGTDCSRAGGRVCERFVEEPDAPSEHVGPVTRSDLETTMGVPDSRAGTNGSLGSAMEPPGAGGAVA